MIIDDADARDRRSVRRRQRYKMLTELRGEDKVTANPPRALDFHAVSRAPWSSKGSRSSSSGSSSTSIRFGVLATAIWWFLGATTTTYADLRADVDGTEEDEIYLEEEEEDFEALCDARRAAQPGPLSPPSAPSAPPPTPPAAGAPARSDRVIWVGLGALGAPRPTLRLCSRLRREQPRAPRAGAPEHGTRCAACRRTLAAPCRCSLGRSAGAACLCSPAPSIQEHRGGRLAPRRSLTPPLGRCASPRSRRTATGHSSIA